MLSAIEYRQPGRLGISYGQVATAAESIAAKGLRPTLRAIREVLGTGSMNTIQAHFHKWLATLPALPEEPVPHSSLTAQRLTSQLSQHNSAIQQLLESLNAQLTTERDALQSDCDALRARVAELEAALSKATTAEPSKPGVLIRLHTVTPTNWAFVNLATGECFGHNGQHATGLSDRALSRLKYVAYHVKNPLAA